MITMITIIRGRPLGRGELLAEGLVAACEKVLCDIDSLELLFEGPREGLLWVV